MLEKKENQNTQMHQMILDDPICEHVRDESSYLIAAEYANYCREQTEIRFSLA